MAEACWEVLDDGAGGEPAILVGESVGWHIVMHMANQQPERTRAVIMSGAGWRPTKENLLVRAETYATQGLDFRRTHALQGMSAAFAATPLGQYFADMFQERNQFADRDTIVTMFRALAEPDPDWLQAGVRCPTIVLTGSEDNSHAGAFDLQKRIPNCELETIQGAGHVCNLEQPWVWDHLAIDFLWRHNLMPETYAAKVGATP
jgi:pimeloyl-ACP methyl ester carboxylesterase